MLARAIKLSIFGGISGIISFFSIAINLGFLFFAPGVIYGLILSLGFLSLSNKISFWKIIVFTIASTIIYFVAFYITLNISFLFSEYHIPTGELIPFMFGGFVGSLLLLLAFHYLIVPLSVKNYWKLVLLGTVLSASMFIDGSLYSPSSSVGLASLFIFWQIGMSIGLGLGTNATVVVPEADVVLHTESGTPLQQNT